ncbi:pimeloyl-ACP methyl ester carboxylesterase [Paenibacillus phyllosphaerae]|uniref:Pimeloyl-ACP methyl ester carboxylesterase n=1 Tax=Paenibacillus phyllosphaerae TaxID=274593 RepID=A0A7W5FLC7_9BACL|nr:alpha/beta hydrolase [Paenibacillus phyllosphaerae]MBB3108852.1 pimeloyl-ACP methyl ester carboxylesterase [Paenibacillus phyllosphaerae]
MMNVMIVMLQILLRLLVAGAGVLLIYRQVISRKIYKAHQIRSEKGIDEELVLDIGGIKQYLYIRGEDSGNPVVLFLHGGPGGPMTPMLYKYQYEWESYCTVVNWDQRNAGRTYLLNKNHADEVLATLTVDRMVEDIHEIVLYLKKRFRQESIIIMGHSWGTIIGSLFVQRYPALTSGYIGVAQVVQLDEGVERMAAEIRKRAEAQGSTKDAAAVDRLAASLRQSFVKTEKIAADLYRIAKRYYAYKPDPWMFIKTGLRSPYFSLNQLAYFSKREALQAPLAEYVSRFDLRERGVGFEVPVVMMIGEYDLHFRYMLDDYYEMIQAPSKQRHTIDDAGHDTMLEQPEAFSRALKGIVGQLAG